MSGIKFKNLQNHFFIIILIFIIDRVSKIYLLNLYESGTNIDFYIFPFLNIYLAWNTGIGFGLFSSDPNIFYHLLTALIAIINLVLIILLFNLNDIRKYFISMILGGSLGNFHWFIFNIADIFITIGIVCLIFVEIFSKNINKEHNAKNN